MSYNGDGWKLWPYALRNETGFSSKQSNLLSSKTAQRYRSAPWLNKKTKTNEITKFLWHTVFFRGFCIFHVWASHCAEWYISTRLVGKKVLWLWGKADFFLKRVGTTGPKYKTKIKWRRGNHEKSLGHVFSRKGDCSSLLSKGKWHDHALWLHRCGLIYLMELARGLTKSISYVTSFLCVRAPNRSFKWLTPSSFYDVKMRERLTLVANSSFLASVRLFWCAWEVSLSFPSFSHAASAVVGGVKKAEGLWRPVV